MDHDNLRYVLEAEEISVAGNKCIKEKTILYSSDSHHLLLNDFLLRRPSDAKRIVGRDPRHLPWVVPSFLPGPHLPNATVT